MPYLHPTTLLRLSALLLPWLLCSCEQDTYEKGTGQYSLLQADFIEAYVDNNKLVSHVTTDDDVTLQLVQPYTPRWEAKTDTIYRALLYYNKVEGKAEVVTLALVPTSGIVPVDSLKDGMKTDPVRFESAWLSKHRRYLNVGIYLKIGQTDNSEAIHKMGIVADSVATAADGKRTLCLQLYHDQGGMPEYYSQRSYFSIPLQGITTDSIALTLNTYDGVVSKRFALR